MQLKAKIIYKRFWHFPLKVAFASILAISMGIGTLALAAEPPVRVFAAISLSESLTDAAKEFKAQTGISILYNLGASGQLAAQIEQGAPADVFIPAAAKQMEPLIKVGMVRSEDISIIARNRMVLVSPKDIKYPPGGFQALAGSDVTRIAIGEPRTVPAGQYALEVLKSLDLLDTVKGKLIYAANVRQVLDYVERGEVDAGLIYQSDAMTSDQIQVVAVAESNWHTPIEYPAGVLKNSDRKAQAEQFVQWLAGPDGQQILKAHGFSDVEPTSRPAGE